VGTRAEGAVVVVEEREASEAAPSGYGEFPDAQGVRKTRAAFTKCKFTVDLGANICSSDRRKFVPSRFTDDHDELCLPHIRQCSLVQELRQKPPV
jgi:hypothetical protein